jgi:hypothetical protein
MQAYSDPRREDEPYALSDVEVFYVDRAFLDDDLEESVFVDGDGNYMGDGWYWWSCFPGCLPDSEPYGPYETEAEALADAQDCDS